MPMTPESSQTTLQIFRRTQGQRPFTDEERREISEHLSAVHDVLERHGYRPFGRLTITMPNTHRSDLIEWERSR